MQGTEFSQTLQSNTAMSAIETCKAEDPVVVVDTEKNNQQHYEKSQWMLSAPDPPTLWQELVGSVRNTISQYQERCSSLKGQPGPKVVLSLLRGIFPILGWGRNYAATKFRNDLLAGLTIASLCIPQV